MPDRSVRAERKCSLAVTAGNEKLPPGNTLVDDVYRQLKKDIIEEYLPAGKKINLNDLCARYGTSPTPIKQALNRLIAEGMVESIPRKGCRVRPFNWTWVDELFEIRLMMELYFAPQTADAVKTSPVLQSRFERNLEENLEVVWRYSSAEDYFRTYELDGQFHELLILASGNQTALRVYKGLNTHSFANYLYGRQPHSQTVNGILEHQAMYRSMREGDVEQLREQIKTHIENARNKIRLALKLAEI